MNYKLYLVFYKSIQYKSFPRRKGRNKGHCIRDKLRGWEPTAVLPARTSLEDDPLQTWCTYLVSESWHMIHCSMAKINTPERGGHDPSYIDKIQNLGWLWLSYPPCQSLKKKSLLSHTYNPHPHINMISSHLPLWRNQWFHRRNASSLSHQEDRHFYHQQLYCSLHSY